MQRYRAYYNKQRLGRVAVLLKLSLPLPNSNWQVRFFHYENNLNYRYLSPGNFNLVISLLYHTNVTAKYT